MVCRKSATNSNRKRIQSRLNICLAERQSCHVDPLERKFQATVPVLRRETAHCIVSGLFHVDHERLQLCSDGSQERILSHIARFETASTIIRRVNRRTALGHHLPAHAPATASIRKAWSTSVDLFV
jgi:hypothetical protein